MGCRKAPHPLACGAASGRAGLWPHGCSGRRMCFVGPGCLVRPWVAARPRDRHTRASLGVVDLEARPCPAAAHGHRSQALRPLRRPPHRRRCVADVCLCVGSLSGQAPPLPINFARNSPAACSIIEFASLELQCFWGVSKNDHDKLRAKFGRRRRLVADVLLGALLRSQAGSRASKRSLSSVSHAIP